MSQSLRKPGKNPGKGRKIGHGPGKAVVQRGGQQAGSGGANRPGGRDQAGVAPGAGGILDVAEVGGALAQRGRHRDHGQVDTGQVGGIGGERAEIVRRHVLGDQANVLELGGCTGRRAQRRVPEHVGMRGEQRRPRLEVRARRGFVVGHVDHDPCRRVLPRQCDPGDGRNRTEHSSPEAGSVI